MWKRLDKRDQQIFQFIVLDFNWDEYFDIFIKGIRIFLFRDELKTLEMSRKKYQRYIVILLSFEYYKNFNMTLLFVIFIDFFLFMG